MNLPVIFGGDFLLLGFAVFFGKGKEQKIHQKGHSKIQISDWEFRNLKKKDASFLLTVEVFLLTVRLFYLRWGNRK